MFVMANMVKAQGLNAKFVSPFPPSSPKGEQWAADEPCLETPPPQFQPRIPSAKQQGSRLHFFKAFGMTRPKMEPTTDHSQGRHSTTRPLSDIIQRSIVSDFPSLDRQMMGGDKQKDEKFPLGCLGNSNSTLYILEKWKL